ncbi:MAG: RNA polymerase recycling motor ATPase HelR [Ancrocorticia sp.]
MPTPLESSMFVLPQRLAGKADPRFTARDEQQFGAIAAAIDHQKEEVAGLLDARRKAGAHFGGEVVERDQEIRRLSSQLAFLQRFGVDLCLGRMVTEAQTDPVYIGRAGLRSSDGEQLLIDWRAPAARPFFSATRADSMGLASRRRYRWNNGKVADYWDEVFAAGNFGDATTYDDESAFIASLGADRSPRMRDVLSTIQADQDAIIRASSWGTLVVDGGPGTGKTVVALHRAAYLMYAEPRISDAGGILFIGPNSSYLRYVDDVLPGLGENNVQLATLRDLVPEGAGALAAEVTEDVVELEIAALKGTAQMVAAIDAAVRFYEEPPREAISVETARGEFVVESADWSEAFGAVGRDTPHNEGKREVLESLVEILVDRLDIDDEDDDELARARDELARSFELRSAVRKAWPILDPAEVVGDLWSVPAYLAMCAPGLSGDEVKRLQRSDAQAWTTADLPLLDAARFRIGDPDQARREERQTRERARVRADMDDVVADLIANDDTELKVMWMLSEQDMREALEFDEVREVSRSERLAGPFGHVVVDEAQELTAAQWEMITRRCPSRSVTVVGDRAQARTGFAESWEERLGRVGLAGLAGSVGFGGFGGSAGSVGSGGSGGQGGVRVATLRINYRTPEEIMAEAEPVIRTVYPQANVPVSVRSGGCPVEYVEAGEWREILTRWLVERTGGTACVVALPKRIDGVRADFRGVVGAKVVPGGEGLPAGAEAVRAGDAVVFLEPVDVKGLEFDLVILIDPEAWGTGVTATVDRYVAMTRATKRLVIAGS